MSRLSTSRTDIALHLDYGRTSSPRDTRHVPVISERTELELTAEHYTRSTLFKQYCANGYSAHEAQKLVLSTLNRFDPAERANFYVQCYVRDKAPGC